MAADKTVQTAAHFTISSGTPYILNLTGAGKYIDVIAHSHGSSNDIYFVVGPDEASLPSITVEGDDTLIAHADERIRIPVPRDTWIKIIANHNMVVSVIKVATIS